MHKLLTEITPRLQRVENWQVKLMPLSSSVTQASVVLVKPDN
jgi:hypothetical protein